MRTTDVLLDELNNVKIFQQYLYMSEDHNVIIHNCIGVPLRIRMDEKLVYWCQNMNFPNVPESCWAEELTLPKTLDVIEVLKEEPAIEFPNRFKNRWEEIKMICLSTTSQNEMNRRE